MKEMGRSGRAARRSAPTPGILSPDQRALKGDEVKEVNPNRIAWNQFISGNLFATNRLPASLLRQRLGH
jgi:hypothetical protein